MSLAVVQLDLAEANAYVDAHHRHSLPVLRHKFSIGAVAESEIVGVAIVERPKARGLQDGWTLEVTRVCTTGHRNACSFLYGASWRLIKAFGYLRAVTYTKADEDGASLRAAGWQPVGRVRGWRWDTPSRPRADRHEVSDRIRWEVLAAGWHPDLLPRPVVPVLTVAREQMALLPGGDAA